MQSMAHPKIHNSHVSPHSHASPKFHQPPRRERGSAGQHQGAAMKKGWQTKTLGDVCSLLNRGISPAYFEEGGVCVLNQKCIRDHEVSYEPSRRHDPKAKKVAAERFIQLGDVLVNSTGTGTLGRVAQVRDEPEEATTVDSHVTIVRPKPGLFHLDFFGYMLVVIEDAIKEAGEGCGGQTELARSVLAERFSVSYPESLAEQQRIVGLLDEAFEGLATAKANAEKNLQNARALFESHLQSVFADQWQTGELVTLTDLATDITDGDHLPPPKSPTGVPFITIGNIVKETRKIDFSDTFMVPHAYYNALKPYKKPRQGDVLYTVTGSFGIPVIVCDDAEFCFQRHIGLVRPKPETSSSWLYYLLMSPQLLKQANEGATGTAQKTVSLKLLRGFVVPKVSPKQQKQAVEKLDALSEETQRLARLYEQKLAALEALKKSLLHQAFTGEL
ncbi:MAG: restriction endonuclease subunit S [Verrucomicrobia bacterium]|nr:MAG: restriction endonuclease subunit S [Verrucomicrobiota bacterium]